MLSRLNPQFLDNFNTFEVCPDNIYLCEVLSLKFFYNVLEMLKKKNFF